MFVKLVIWSKCDLTDIVIFSVTRVVADGFRLPVYTCVRLLLNIDCFSVEDAVRRRSNFRMGA